MLQKDPKENMHMSRLGPHSSPIRFSSLCLGLFSTLFSPLSAFIDVIVAQSPKKNTTYTHQAEMN